MDQILDVTEQILPLDLGVVFGNQNPYVLEIGFGDGEFLVEMAARTPERNFVGIEVKRRRFLRGVKKANRVGLKNIKLLHMEAEIALWEVFGGPQFSVVYINFPDPWPKEKHLKHRIVNREVMGRISELMLPGAVLEIATDHKDYFASSVDVVGSMDCFTNDTPPPGYVNEIPGRPYTKYETGYRAEGREIYYMVLRNVADHT